MRLRLERLTADGVSTRGLLRVLDGAVAGTAWHTLEPPRRERYGSIPPGTYDIRFDPSPRYGRDMLELMQVPGRAGILIHAGNRVEESRGCILLGRRRAPLGIAESRLAVQELETLVRAATRAGDRVTVEVLDPATEDEIEQARRHIGGAR